MILLLATIGASILNIVLIFLVDRVVCQVNESFVYILLAICILLCGKSSQTFLEEIHFKWIKSCHERINAQIVLETIDQVWVADVLGHDIARLALNFLLLANDFDTTTT